MVYFISVDIVGIRGLMEVKYFSKELWEADALEAPTSEADTVAVLIKGVTRVGAGKSR